MNLTGVPGISGMVKVAPNQFLVVHDTKGPGPRLGVIDVQANGPRYQVIDNLDWPSKEPLPNDLEGICAMPQRPGEYLIVESGFYKSKYGRVLRIRYPGRSVSGAEYVGSFRPFDPPADGDTPKHEQIEGIASVVHDGTAALLFALRGSASNPNQGLPGQLIWGTLADIDKPNPRFLENGRCSLSTDVIANRGAADLFVRPSGVGSANIWEVLSVATVDPHDNPQPDDLDLGPFLSAVYLAGTLSVSSSGNIEFIANGSTLNVLWHIQGLKVEALAAPADLIPLSALSVATDDETYKGIWRPLAPSKGPQAPSKMLFIENVLAAVQLK
jgi:hypothetical protein